MDRNDLPLGFGFALAQDPEAMKHFSALPEAEQAQLLQKARSVSSRQEMQAIVRSLSAQG